jgi:hypothetical protein
MSRNFRIAPNSPPACVQLSFGLGNHYRKNMFGEINAWIDEKQLGLMLESEQWRRHILQLDL